MSAWQWQQAIGFQLFWFCNVLGGNQWLGLALLIIVCHFVFTPTRKQDLYMMLFAVVGISSDGILTAFGVFEFSAPPLWLAVLWLGFALTIGHSLTWLRRLSLFQRMLLGACAGTSSYLAAYRLGAVSLPLGLWLSAPIIALAWSQLLPLLVAADRNIRDLP